MSTPNSSGSSSSGVVVVVNMATADNEAVSKAQLEEFGRNTTNWAA
jgi:hypothetical protein